MKSREEFELSRTPIGEGTMLIEASAGTGKTFTIAGLVLRLLLERPTLTIDRILVTTFTELATAELRGRIRALLGAAENAFRSGFSEDSFISALLSREKNRDAAARRLRDALVNFDEAPIHTIHAFCQRVLAERAFESGSLFDAELVANQSDLLREIVNDFWRLSFYSGSRFSTFLAARNKITPEYLLESIEELTKNPTLRILPDESRPLPVIIREFETALGDLRRTWAKDEAKVRALFADGSWALHNHGKPEKMLPLLDDLAQCLSEDGGTAEHLNCLEAFATRTIQTRVRAGRKAPESAVFHGCERLLNLDREFAVALRAQFFAYARREMRDRKEAQNVFSYDDLLTRLDDALAGPDGAELAEMLRAKYQAALIDEFQDTDPVQYSIFSRIYFGSGATVAFIGDPKQAIYSFRGADVFTYMEAASVAQRQFTLTTNWRSESGLVGAVNTIFGREHPFLLDDIRFDPAAANPRADDRPLRVNGNQEPPFYLWVAAKEADVPAHVASRILQLLTRGVTIGHEALEPRHIAVLTSTNPQAAAVQRALRERRIPSVLYSSANIFVTDEARELRDVLAAVAQPGYEKYVRAALCTDVLGRSGNDLDALTRDDAAWEKELLGFQEHHQRWRDHGFIQMLRHLSAKEGVRRRLLGFPDGERRLTNFLHLTELLHRACVDHRLGMNGLLKWLGQQMNGTEFAEREEHELRLESDERAVRIITVHKSKGLEFDVVFCPYISWFRREPRATFHDPAAGNRLTLDLEDSDAEKDRREMEARAELLRQFYVSVTRARHRCEVIWKPTEQKKDKSAPGYLLGNSEALPAEISANREIAVAPLPDATPELWRPQPAVAPSMLRPREFTGTIDRSWGISSFSRLISGRETDLLDEGPLVEPAADDEVEASGIHAFPKGTRAGTCLHEILEEIDFADLDGAPPIVQRRLRAYGVEGFDEVVTDNLHALCRLPLLAGKDRFSLADLPRESRMAELEFSFPVDSFTTKKMAALFEMEKLPLRIDRLQFQTVNGFMTGFIDLVFAKNGRFYFADWKSNWLGPTTGAYSAARIAGEMEHNFYTLQLCLYSVALDRYLRLRQPGYDFDKHFGGAFYIFLRGIDPERPTNGIYFQRLNRELIEKLNAIFQE